VRFYNSRSLVKKEYFALDLNITQMRLLIRVLLFFILPITTISAQDTFPESWLGNYKGDLLIYSVDSVKMNVKMELKIAKTEKDSIFDWTIIYNIKGKKDIRAYRLVVVDREKGWYQIDERNTIIIDAYLYNNSVFTSFFKVGKSYIVASYTKKKDHLVFEIIAGKTEPVSITGKTKFKEEDIPQVDAYPVSGRQKAILFKISSSK